MLEREECDAVGIATPDFTRVEPLLVAVAQGKHILREKALVTRQDRQDQMHKAVLKSGCRVMVDYYNCSSPPFAITKQRLAAGELGTPVNGNQRLSDTILAPLEYIPRAASSSIIWFQGSDAMDSLSRLFADRVMEVYSVCHDGVLKGRGIDTYLMTLEFAQGWIAQIENGWIVPNTSSWANVQAQSTLHTRCV